MKKVLSLFIILLIVNQLSQAQSVTLATTMANPTKGTVVFNNGNNQLQYWNGTAWIPITNAAAATGWALNGNTLYSTNAGNVGIGTTSPASKLVIRTPNNTDGFTHESDGGIILKEAVGGVSAAIGTYSNHTFRLVANSTPIINIDQLGNVGVGIADQTYKMDISDRIRLRSGVGTTAGLWLNNPNNSAIIAFMGVKDVDLAGLYGNNSGWGLLMNTNTGAISLGSQNPVAGYKLSVQGNEYINGTLVTTGDAEIGGIGSVTGNMYVGGKLGVGGAANIPLEVWSEVEYNRLNSWSYYDNGGFSENTLSIRAHGDIMASVFVSISDARIKNIIGTSNSAKDLETIKALRITDYTMKDKIEHGNKLFKKVIAQEVEKVYPQAVSQHTSIIPDIYSLAEKVTFDKTKNKLTVLLSKNYDIKMGDKIELVHPEKGKLQAIVESVSGNSFTLKDWHYPTDKIFVFGREVNDFRTVDYEAISMLGISAIQQLAKEIEDLKAQNSKLKSDFSSRLEAIETLLSKTQTGN